MKQNAYMGSPITAHRYREHISRHELEIKCLRIKLHNLNILYVSIVKVSFQTQKKYKMMQEENKSHYV